MGGGVRNRSRSEIYHLIQFAYDFDYLATVIFPDATHMGQIRRVITENYVYFIQYKLYIWCYLSKSSMIPATDIAPFYNSPFYRGTVNPLGDARAKVNDKKESASPGETQSVMKYVWTPEFILFMVWASIGNMDITFISFNWNKFARIVSGQRSTDQPDEKSLRTVPERFVDLSFRR